MFGVSLQAGRGIPLNAAFMLIPYAQLDYRYWDRQVGGAGNQMETYTNWAALGGLMAQMSLAPRWVLSVSGAAGTTFGANMNDGFADYALGSAFLWQTKARLGLRITPRLEWTGTLGFTHFEFGQSPVVFEPSNAFCAAGCLEPHSPHRSALIDQRHRLSLLTARHRGLALSRRTGERNAHRFGVEGIGDEALAIDGDHPALAAQGGHFAQYIRQDRLQRRFDVARPHCDGMRRRRADEKLALAGTRHTDAIVSPGARADDRTVADPAGHFVGRAAGRGSRGDCA